MLGKIKHDFVYYDNVNYVLVIPTDTDYNRYTMI